MIIIECSGKDKAVMSEITEWSAVMIGVWDDLHSYSFMMLGMENSPMESSLNFKRTRLIMKPASS